MGKKISKKTYIQKEQRKKNKLNYEKEKLKSDEKLRLKQEKSAKRNKIILIVSSIVFCLFFCFISIGSIGIILYRRSTQTNRLFWSGLVAAQLDSKWGYINEKGKTKINFEYDFAYNFTKNKLALVGKDNKFGYINTKGKFVIDPIYDNAVSFSGDVAICKLNGKYGTIDKHGDVVTEFLYSNIMEYSGNFAIAFKDNKYGIIDKKGNVIVDFAYDKIESVNSSYFVYYDDGSTYLGVLNENQSTDTFFAESFQDLKLLDNGYCIYKRKGLYGLIDNKKNVVIENRFVKLTYERGDYLVFSTTGDYYGYVDFKGKVVIREIYAYASSFDKYSVVKYSGNDLFFIINKNGKHKFQIECDFINDYHKKRAVFNLGDYYGVVSPNGKVMVEAKYKYISNFYDDGYAIVMSKDNLYGIVRVDGAVKVEPKYKNIAYSVEK